MVDPATLGTIAVVNWAIHSPTVGRIAERGIEKLAVHSVSSAAGNLFGRLDGQRNVDKCAVLQATHDAYVAAMVRMASAATLIANGGGAEDVASAAAFNAMVKKSAFKDFRITESHLPHGDARDAGLARSADPANFAQNTTQTLYDWGVDLSPALLGLFNDGHRQYPSWATVFRAEFDRIFGEGGPAYNLLSLELAANTNQVVHATHQDVAAIAAALGAPPLGLVQIAADADVTTPVTRFRDFLRSANLPYFSRAAHQRAIGTTWSEDKEASWVDQLITGGSRGWVAIISGPGGVGKTRLANELCQRMMRAGWLAFTMTHDCDSAAVTQYLAALPPGTKAVLFVDYGEAAAGLSALVDQLPTGGAGADCRIIVTCRASAAYEVRQRCGDLGFFDINLSHSEKSGDSRDYLTWVVEQILAHHQVPDPTPIAAGCGALPVLAAFAAFLHKVDPGALANDLTGLHAEPAFTGWLNRRRGRLLANCADPVEAKQLLPVIMASLPFNPALRNDASAAEVDLRARLKADRWIETEGSYLVAAHDVFADTMLADHLFEMPDDQTQRCTALLTAAHQRGSLTAALIAVQRLAGDARFDSIDRDAVITALMTQNTALSKAIVTPLFMGQFMTGPAKVKLLADNSQLRTFISKDNALDPIIAHLAEDEAKRANVMSDAEWEAAASALNEPLAAVIDRHRASSTYVRRAYEFHPDAYRGDLIDRIADDPLADDTHFLLAALLRKEDLTDDTAEARETTTLVGNWLTHNATALSASYIYKGWLEAKGDAAAIAGHARSWMAAHGREFTAVYVITSWCKWGGNPVLVAAYVEPWLAAHSEHIDAGFVLQHCAPLVSAAGDDASVDQIAFITAATRWLAIHNQEQRCSFVYPILLLNPQISPIILPVIEDQLEVWLNRYADEVFAGSIITAWHRARHRDVAHSIRLKPFMARWLEHHAMSIGATYVLERALENYADDSALYPVVRAQAAEWLEQHYRERDAAFILQPLAKCKDLDFETVCRTIVWATIHPGHVDAMARLQKATPYIDDDGTGGYTLFSDDEKIILCRLFEVGVKAIADALYQNKCDDDAKLDDIKFSIALNLSKIKYRNWKFNLPTERVEYMFSEAMRSNIIFNKCNTMLLYKDNFLKSLIQCIKAGRIYIDDDISSINEFLDWVSHTANPDEQAAADLKLAVVGLSLPQR